MIKALKKIFICGALTAFVACGNGGYEISGEYPSAADGTMVYLANIDADFTKTDSAVVKGGRFSFTGRQDTPVVRMILSSIALDGGPVVVENGNIDVQIKKGFRRKGTPLNNDMQRFFSERAKMARGIELVGNYLIANSALTDAQRDSLQGVVAEARTSFVAMLQKSIGDNVNNALGAFLLTQSEEYFTPQELHSIMSMVPENLRDERFNAMYARVKIEVENSMRAFATAVGCPYINFELPDVNGKQVLLSNIVNANKYTLLDFWASWCIPCRQEAPVLKKIAADYGKRGVAIVSVSLDSSHEEWKEGVSSLGLGWTQLCSPAGGSAEAAAAYGISSIPMLILIDAEGNIVMRGEPAYRVAQQLEELMK